MRLMFDAQISMNIDVFLLLIHFSDSKFCAKELPAKAPLYQGRVNCYKDLLFHVIRKSA